MKNGATTQESPSRARKANVRMGKIMNQHTPQMFVFKFPSKIADRSPNLPSGVCPRAFCNIYNAGSRRRCLSPSSTKREFALPFPSSSQSRLTVGQKNLGKPAHCVSRLFPSTHEEAAANENGGGPGCDEASSGKHQLDCRLRIPDSGLYLSSSQHFFHNKIPASSAGPSPPSRVAMIWPIIC